ncbi:cytidylyltransferase family-domain-containing protein [Microdochium bolleyi]|uniref:Phosphatidate cytidylyltransferase n=1 Tax=Microdochium bolleyi TaxID=196109 RepID=A0A136IVZ9_9PEZI|nr:cytidylyltransferase family-domain-containing protein [Microdochium bolleyi]
MTKPRRGVQFPRRNGVEGRRSSMSGSEDGSSPLKTMNSPKLDGIHEIPKGTQDEKAPPQSDYEKKKAVFFVRTFWTLVMIGLFFGALFMGHIYILACITAVQIICFKEVIAIASVPTKARDLKAIKSLNWYWLGTTMYFLYGESVIYYFKHIVLIDKALLPLATHHRFISFVLYVIGFVFFVANLRSGHLKFQFTNFAWTHMALYLIVVQAHFVMNNVFEGMIWFFLPASLVITNDIFAYLCGITFGRTQLLKISPKKTVEGFVGAWFCTVIWAFLTTNLLMRSSYFICPVNDLGANIFTGLECEPNPVFLPKLYELPHLFFLPEGTNISFTMEPMQIHAIMFATFASLIAPFGGFFASGLKRTFKIKDFGDSIPGHGGMTDRMDCQFIMGCFAFMYYHNFIAQYNVTYADLLELAINGLSIHDQKELFKGLNQYLENQGVLGPDVARLVEKSLLR